MTPGAWHDQWASDGDGDRTAIIAAEVNTAGVSRNMAAIEPFGGGDLNGSANVAHLMGQAGTPAIRIGLPRAGLKAGGGNFAGIV